MSETEIENLKIIKHFKDEYGNIHGIYKCNVSGKEEIFIRHGDEVGVIRFWLNEPVEKCISKVKKDVAKEIIMLVEIENDNKSKIIKEMEKAKKIIKTQDYCAGINAKENCASRSCFDCCTDYLIEIVKRGGTNEVD